MKTITGQDIIAFADTIANIKNVIPVAYLRGAEAALSSDPPDVAVARQLIRQAIGELEAKRKPTSDGDPSRLILGGG